VRGEEILDIKSLKEVLYNEELFIVLDKKVKDLHGEKLKEIFEGLKYSPVIFDNFSGEKDKSLKKYKECVSFFLDQKIHRKAKVLAVGGGATSDFAGFVASSILRGVGWSIIPTTLLSMVDASIGGKTGLNVKEGKNLIGAFHEADYVFIDSSFLETLPEEEFVSGKGEILKYALLNKDIYNQVLSKTSFNELIYSCARYKQQIVKEDFKEQGKRILLNLGHTFGHAFELCFDISHGRAVAEGIIFKDRTLNSSKLKESLDLLLEALGIKAPFLSINSINENWNRIIDYIAHDKKKSNKNNINILLPTEIGHVKVQEISIEKIKNLFNT
jgi:3-dehydroquinate synthase